MDVESGICQVQGGLDPGDAGADYHNLTYRFLGFRGHKFPSIPQNILYKKFRAGIVNLTTIYPKR
jgi:hypothetical protein